jgi:uncharacterized coiled-coil protein SlyX
VSTGSTTNGNGNKPIVGNWTAVGVLIALGGLALTAVLRPITVEQEVRDEQRALEREHQQELDALTTKLHDVINENQNANMADVSLRATRNRDSISLIETEVRALHEKLQEVEGQFARQRDVDFLRQVRSDQLTRALWQRVYDEPFPSSDITNLGPGQNGGK